MISTHTSLLATAVAPHLFWITSRAAGIAALLLSSVSVCIGLTMGARLGKANRVDLRVAHEALSLATLAAIAVHGLTLLGDSYISPSLGDIFSSVPERLQDVLDEHRHHRVLGTGAARPVLLRARQDRRPALAQTAPLHRPGVDAGDRTLPRRGHRRGPDVVPGDDRGGGPAGTGAAGGPAAALLRFLPGSLKGNRSCATEDAG